MMVIHKYQFGVRPAMQTLPEFGKPFFMNIPSDARFLSFQVQEGVPTMWVSVESNEHLPRYAKMERRFMLVMTGQEFVGSDLVYFGTCQLNLQAGNFVLHLYGERSVKV